MEDAAQQIQLRHWPQVPCPGYPCVYKEFSRKNHGALFSYENREGQITVFQSKITKSLDCGLAIFRGITPRGNLDLSLHHKKWETEPQNPCLRP